jgi:hypothetical protein
MWYVSTAVARLSGIHAARSLSGATCGVCSVAATTGEELCRNGLVSAGAETVLGNSCAGLGSSAL